MCLSTHLVLNSPTSLVREHVGKYTCRICSKYLCLFVLRFNSLSAFPWLLYRSPDSTGLIECSLELVQQRLVRFKNPACPWLYSTHHTTRARTVQSAHTLFKFTHTYPHCLVLYTMHIQSTPHTRLSTVQFTHSIQPTLTLIHTHYTTDSHCSVLTTHMFIHPHTHPSTHFPCTNAPMQMLYTSHHTILVHTHAHTAHTFSPHHTHTNTIQSTHHT